ncbi:MAG: hypothetical protein LW884_02850 [Bacteroidetes bacterium]|nr:hypothetical protein [Bacteroidota bacterium]
MLEILQRITHFLPIATTLVSILFGRVLWLHWRRKPQATYLLVWFIGIVAYGVGTLTESLTALLDWQEPVFYAWFISGALLGGAPLAQGTVYLLFNRRFAHLTSALLVLTVLVASFFILRSPIDYSQVEPQRLSGAVLVHQWVRWFSPFINTYAVIFLIGGAFYSAFRYRRQPDGTRRYQGNIWIAVGALLPGIGGGAARAGYVEVLYVGELVGLLCIWQGYRVIRSAYSGSVHAAQQQAAALP